MKSPHALLITALCSLVAVGCGDPKYKPDPVTDLPQTEQDQELPNFTKYCQSPESAAVTQTVEAIKKLAATEDCAAAQAYLSAQTQLIIDGAPLGDLRPLAKLTGLKALNLRATSLDGQASLEGLQGLSGLETLDVSRNSLPAGVVLGQFPALKELTIEDSKVTDTAWLSASCPLTKLNLSTNRLSDFSGIASCKQLQWLALDSTEMTDGDSQSAGLAQLKELSTLQLSDNSLSHVEFAAGLSKLEELKANANGIEVVDSLGGLMNLKTVEMNGNKIESIEPLKPLPNLARISFVTNPVLKWSDTYLVRCPVKDTASKTLADYCDRHLKSHHTFLWHCLFVTEATDPRRHTVGRVLEEIGVATDACITGYSKLLTEPTPALNLRKQGGKPALSTLAPLADPVFAKVKKLHLAHNTIEDLQPLALWTGLQFLGAVKNPVTRMPALRNLRSLEQLWLPDTDLVDLKFLDQAGDNHPLKTFYINGKNLTSYDGLQNLPNLAHLQLGPSPEVKSAEVVGELTNLMTLSILGNRQYEITDFSKFDKLKYLGLVAQSNERPFLHEIKLSDIARVEHLDARFNREINSTFFELPSLLPDLRSLNLFGNPGVNNFKVPTGKVENGKWSDLTRFCAIVPVPKTEQVCPTDSAIAGIKRFCQNGKGGGLPGCKGYSSKQGFGSGLSLGFAQDKIMADYDNSHYDQVVASLLND